MDQNSAPLMKRWTHFAITLLFLSALIVAGVSVYYTHQEQRRMYMRVGKQRHREMYIRRRSPGLREGSQTEAAQMKKLTSPALVQRITAAGPTPQPWPR